MRALASPASRYLRIFGSAYLCNLHAAPTRTSPAGHSNRNDDSLFASKGNRGGCAHGMVVATTRAFLLHSLQLCVRWVSVGVGVSVDGLLSVDVLDTWATTVRVRVR